MEKIVIIPTFNEKDNIACIIQAVFSLNLGYHILVIDDGSPDGTAAIVKELIQLYPNELFLEERRGKLGLGTAYIHGFKWCLNRAYQYIFEMDADFSHDPNSLIPLMEACENGADMSVGSRYIRGGKIENWPKNRILMSYFASIYVRIITWMPVADTTGGFVCYKKNTLSGINLDQIAFVGYAFQIEMKYAVWSSGFKIKEVPITFKDRVRGMSKMSTKIFKEAFWGVLQIRKNTLFNKFYYKAISSISS